MKRFALVAIVAIAACHSSAKPDGTGGGSSGGAPSAAPAAAATAQPGAQGAPTSPPGQAVAGTPAAAPASAPIAQPERVPADVARFADAEHAFADALAAAKQAKTLKEACSGLDALMKTLENLQQGDPPAGFERAYNEQRGGLVTRLDVMQSQDCAGGSGADADLIRDELESLRKQFVKLQGIGAKQ